ncbi:glutamyl-Q tRNA(Asp) synthetase [Termitidicoccus mucosus]|uniref:Glutamyl-Q tRNA(Asp) synthetase n=1 Tax=Termitidicoccus mucosus TaxID=1184151 RepID=A0A178IAM4_9BACT|nr:glutamyl-Q tRNA(Asp) synthetase [Opitutaceae bacterium TSB47]
MPTTYTGRLAPSPTGLLHLGHARTFWIAAERARAEGGVLRLRNDDLDRARCRPEFVAAMLEDIAWLGLAWTPPMLSQSERMPLYRAALARLHAANLIYPCHRSRRDVAEAAGAPHEGGDDDEPVFPPAWRPPAGATPPLPTPDVPIAINWRFRVPDGELVSFADGHAGPRQAVAGRDFGDFLVWRKDNTPSYQLACAVDDADMGITEVVRGADLIKSTFRQLLLLRALGATAPAFYHCPLVTDAAGRRLAKRHDALALRTLRTQGLSPASIIERFRNEPAP